jgi:aldehyde dehydrogenase (NAD+)
MRMANLIDGEWVDAGSGEDFADLNPSDTTDVVADVPGCGEGEVGLAIAAARRAAPAWAATSPVARGEILHRAAQGLRARVDRSAQVLSREAGKPLADARGEVLKSADFLEFYAGLGRAACGEVLPDVREGAFTHTRREPLGVVVAITPWNDPLLTPARKLGPALIAGNTVVLKPASDTPVIAQELAEVLQEAGLPRGVLNTVTGPGGRIGAAVTASTEVDAVSFTGSTAIGKRLRQDLAARGVRVQTEMGGKNASVVLPDADLDLAAATVIAAAFGGIGQRCTATSRLVVHRDVRDLLVERLLDGIAALRVGPTGDALTTHGPVISPDQLRTVEAAIGEAVSSGGALLRGGTRLTEAPLDRGYFVDPALIEVEAASRLWQEEVFGPVLAMTTVSGLDEAIDVVNASVYGLSAALFTRDLAASHAFAARVETGQVAINLPTSGWDVQFPFGGYKDSGSLFKEQGVVGVDFYSKVKTVSMRVA